MPLIINSKGIPSWDGAELSYEKAYYAPHLVIDKNMLKKTCRISTDGFAFFDVKTKESISVYDHGGEVEKAKAKARNGVLMLGTSGLQSCYPVVLKFKDGSIGLFHANSNSVDSLEKRMLALGIGIHDRKLKEIQIFTKKKANDNRAENFFQFLLEKKNPELLSNQIATKKELLREYDKAHDSLLVQRDQKVQEQKTITEEKKNILREIVDLPYAQNPASLLDTVQEKEGLLAQINTSIQNVNEQIKDLEQTQNTLAGEISDLNKRVQSLICLSGETIIQIVEDGLDDYGSAVCYINTETNQLITVIANGDIFDSKSKNNGQDFITECTFKDTLTTSSLAQPSQISNNTENWKSPQTTTSTTSSSHLLQTRKQMARFKEKLSLCCPKKTENIHPSIVQPKK